MLDNIAKTRESTTIPTLDNTNNANVFHPHQFCLPQLPPQVADEIKLTTIFMEQIMKLFRGDTNLDLVCQFCRKETIFLAMSSRGLKCKRFTDFLSIATTFTTNNNVPASVQDDRELGGKPTL